MILGCCTTINYYEELANAGYGAITLAGKDIAAMDKSTFEDVRRIVVNGSLRLSSVNSFCPPSIKLNGPNRSMPALCDYTKALCERAAALGITSLGVGSPNSRAIPEGYGSRKGNEEFMQSLDVICAVASEYDMQVLLEALCTKECNCVRTTGEAMYVIKQLRRGNLHMVYDIYHSLMMGESCEVICDAIAQIRAVHICRAENGGRYYMNEQGMAPYMPYLNTLEQLGFDGELSLEAFDGDVSSGIKQSAEALREYI